jgi:hypothetical protein
MDLMSAEPIMRAAVLCCSPMAASDDLAAVRALNSRMHEEETRGAAGVPFFRDLLDQTLRFRRANGAVATRDEFLIDLANPQNRRDRIDAVGEIACDVYENTAVASVLLRVEGANGQTPVEGLFRNLRIFHRTPAGDGWTLMVWFNDRVADPR